MSQNVTKIFTKNVTNTTFTVTAEMGLKQISIILISTGTATYTGSRTTGGDVPDALTLQTLVPINIPADEGSVLDGDIITAASGVTVQIIGK